MAKKEWKTVNVNDFFLPSDTPMDSAVTFQGHSPYSGLGVPPKLNKEQQEQAAQQVRARRSRTTRPVTGANEVEKMVSANKVFDDGELLKRGRNRKPGRNRGRGGKSAARTPTPHIGSNISSPTGMNVRGFATGDLFTNLLGQELSPDNLSSNVLRGVRPYTRAEALKSGSVVSVSHSLTPEQVANLTTRARAATLTYGEIPTGRRRRGKNGKARYNHIVPTTTTTGVDDVIGFDEDRVAVISKARNNVGFERGSKSVYQARLVGQIRELELELSQLNQLANERHMVSPATSGIYDARMLQLEKRIQSLKKDLTSSKKMTMEAINPIYAKHLRAQERAKMFADAESLINAQRAPGQAFSFLNSPIDSPARNALTSRSSLLSQITHEVADDRNVLGINAVEASIRKAELMQDGLPPKFINNYFEKQIKRQQRESERVGRRVRVGQSVLNDRREAKNIARDNAEYIKTMERERDRILGAQNARKAQQQVYENWKNTPVDLSYLDRYQATISAARSQEAQVSQAVARSTQSRSTSALANTIADDTMRAASVIHSSKLGFAAVGMGALGAAFGIASFRANRQDQL